MYSKITFNKQKYNIYKIEQLSSDRVLNFIAQIISNNSGTVWIKQELLKKDLTELSVCGYIISSQQTNKDDLLILEESAVCETGWFDKNCTEPNCCGGVNKEKMEFSKSKLIELLDEWEKLNNLKPEVIELSRNNNKFELKSL